MYTYILYNLVFKIKKKSLNYSIYHNLWAHKKKKGILDNVSYSRHHHHQVMLKTLSSLTLSPSVSIIHHSPGIRARIQIWIRETACLIRPTLHLVGWWAAQTSRVRVLACSLPSIPTLIGLWAFDFVLSPVWWEAATNMHHSWLHLII